MKKKIVLVSLIIILLITSLFVLTGCGNNDNTENNSSNKESVNDALESNYFILKDHKGYYIDGKERYAIEGTIVNKTDQTFENKTIMIRTFAENGKMINLASCSIEKIEPHGEIKIVAATPLLDTNAMQIVRYELSSL